MPFHFTYILVMSLMVEDTEPIVTMLTPYTLAWLQDWNNHMEGVSTLVLVPAQTHPPLIKPKWAQALQTCPLKSLGEFFHSSITFGFRIERPHRSAHKNLQGAFLHPETVEDYLEIEVINHEWKAPTIRNHAPMSTLANLELSVNVISPLNTIL